jgi:arginase
MARFIVVPQWQGSPSPRAMSLIDGAELIAGDLPSSACHRVAVPVEAGESLDTGVLRASTLRRVALHTREELEAFPDEHLIVIGGDGGVSVPAIAHAAAGAGDLAVVWFSARGGLHTPETSPTGAYASMALRAVLGAAPEGLALAEGSVAPERIVMVGARDLDITEELFVHDSGIHAVGVAESAAAIAEAVVATGADRAYVHVDLDVLDPAHIEGVSSPQPFGLEPAALVEAIGAIRERLPVTGASLVGFAPRSSEAGVADMGTILRVIGSLAKA